MHILLLTDALVTGGAETFVVRLASALKETGNQVTLYVLRPDKFDPTLVNKLDPTIRVKIGRINYLYFILKFDGLLFKLGIGFNFLRFFQSKLLSSYLAIVRPDLLHAHLFTSDLVAAIATKNLGIPWITTIHGDYEAYEKQNRICGARVLAFKRELSVIEKSVGHIACITNPQLTQLKRLLPRLATEGRITKIYNGYELSKLDISLDNLPAALLSIPKESFVIGMVARGIKEKGWDVMLAAFQSLNVPDAWLVFVGDGDYIKELKNIVTNPRIIFTGNVSDPLRYIARFDVGCLPSRIPTESLPTVVIEYMMLRKPVIATDVGEVGRMLTNENNKKAGILIKLGTVNEMCQEMCVALERLYHDSSERSRLSAQSLLASSKFDMNKCINGYLSIYQNTLK